MCYSGRCDDPMCSCDGKPMIPMQETRPRHYSGNDVLVAAAADSCSQQHVDENDYLLTTRSCSNIDEKFNTGNSQTPLIHSEETTM